VDIWHINSDEPGIIDYNTEFKGTGYAPDLYQPDIYRSSDHDPIIIGLNLAGPNEYVVPAGTSGTDIQTLLDNAPSGITIILPPGIINVSGGFTLTQPGVTVKLSDGTVIMASSPCFTVAADDVTITSTSIGGGKCVPSNGNSGVEVNTAVNNLRVIGLEIDGTGQTTASGITINAAVNNLQILNNFIHNMGAYAISYGITPVTGIHDVMGNLFSDNITGAVSNSSTTPYLVEHNSWGSVTGPVPSSIVGSFDYTPWTYVGLKAVSSGSLVTDEVSEGTQITYTVQMDASQVTGVDFRLLYDPAALSLISVSDNNLFLHEGSCNFTNSAGVISFCGYRTSELTGTDQALFTVVFQGVSSGVTTLNFDESNDMFAMSPVGPSTNIYAGTLTNKSLTVLDTLSTVTANVRLQGRSNYSGVSAALGLGSAHGFGTYAFSLTDSWGTAHATNVVADTYALSISIPKYLDVTTTGAYNTSKSVAVSSSKLSINSITLLGGDLVSGVNPKDNIITIGDASVLGSNYGTANAVADINGDGIVNLLDLAMVGGNYGLSSATAYVSWVP
jgi:hypothetical protein